MSRLTVFWALHAVAMLVFVAGVWANVSIWLQGSVEGRAPATLGRALAAGWRVVRRAGLRRVLRALAVDGLVHRRLLTSGPWRWLAHACLLGGLIPLALLSAVTGFCREILIGLWHVRWPLVAAIVDKDTPAMALANETLGLLVLLGAALIAFRRLVLRPAQLRTAPDDTLLLAWALFVLLTGYALEALRLLADQVPPAVARYSYLGYTLALLLRPLHWPWAVWHGWGFLLHGTVVSAGIAYLPFSKLVHIAAGPLVAAANSLAWEAGER